MSNDTKKSLRRLGATDYEITPIGIGTWQFAGGRDFNRFVYGGMPQEEINEIIKASFRGGINWFDTAEAYGWGKSEMSLAAALMMAGVSDEEVVIATKWFPSMRTPKSIASTIVKRRMCLKPYSISLHQVHQPIALGSVKAQMDSMADIAELGLIGAVGVSNFPASMMKKAHFALQARGFSLASNQVKVSIMDRHIEKNGVFKAAAEHGITIIAWSPLEMGILSGKFHKDPSLLNSRPPLRRAFLKVQLEDSRDLIRLLEEIAEANGVSCSVVALSWLINFYGERLVAIPGATKVSHAEQNITAKDLVLTQNEMEQIDRASERFKRPVLQRINRRRRKL